MVLTFRTTKILVSLLLFVMIFTSCFMFTSFLAAQPARATGLPVVDILGTITQWAIRALNVAWDAAKVAAQAVWEWNVQLATTLWKAVRENVMAFLAGLAAKTVAFYLSSKVNQLKQKYRIDDYLYYADVLTRQVYAIKYLSQNYSGDQQTQKIILSLIGTGNDIYSRNNDYQTIYEGIMQKTSLNPSCQTSGIHPGDPTYYVSLLNAQRMDCLPTYAMASYQDAAFSALDESVRATQAEIDNSSGYQSIRNCGGVATDAIFDWQPTGSTTITNTTVKVDVQKVQTGETLDIKKSGLALACSVVTQSGSEIASLIDGMVNVVLKNSTDVKQTDTSRNVTNFLSTTFATAIGNLLGFGDGTAFDFTSGHVKLVSANNQDNHDFTRDIPGGINANTPPAMPGTPNVNAGAARDEARVSAYWNSVCTTRLPLLFAIQNGSYPTTMFRDLSAGDLQQGTVTRGSEDIYLFGKDEVVHWSGQPTLTLTGSNPGMTFDQIRSDINNNHRNVSYLLNHQYPFGLVGTDGTAAWTFLWQIYDYTRHIDPDYGSGSIDKWTATGRQYEMAVHGFPTAKDVEQSAKWVPDNWPYYVDGDGNGYIYTASSTLATAEGYVLQGSADSGTIYQKDSNRNNTSQVVSSNGTTGGSVYQTSDGTLLFAFTSESAQGNQKKMWKLNKDLSVVVKDGQIIMNTDSLRDNGANKLFVVDYVANDGKHHAMVATELTPQAPCGQQSYGPPATLSDISEKVQATTDISPDMWSWLLKANFVSGNGAPIQ